MDLDALIEHFDDMNNHIDDDVNEVLKNLAVEGAKLAKENAERVMNKGYWTGNLWREIESAKNRDLEYSITSNAGYSGFLEYGTRYMEAEPFMWPMYLRIQKELVKDLKELLEG
ncbi:TPA: HK97-gp10 family putative phage morphogenesis protein [Staphylococcus aureus]|uniref:HK97-gp10 family putative phage morphogenesis protein n=1 Tax=Staphylococcus aureus TaxID=1280 RepID=UPI000D654550|nr:HK97-gp10 family putative phage morphogenesis protein [Staphylococcus aureus]MBH4765533.1 HK97 gp10 family phage protein [Staphylococcus aureus]MBH4798888.1 HK97 gp10 family phage protein [Staphylococcus aureus]MBH4801570.1 HK97 gp10 family phage protein [Staphylococcus aureus]MBH4806228.1 HK97 gp10 family phage protein [Staphylococcus aureus]MBH4821848.1 HK97 gp10 family phage protein [Staphylococcus aureus]